MIIFGIDPGIANLGWAVLERDGKRMRLADCGTYRTSSRLTDDQRMSILATLVRDTIRTVSPSVVGVEAHVWMGPERSANQEAFRVSRVSGLCEGLAYLGDARIVRVTRQEALKALGARTEDGANATLSRLVSLPAKTSQHARDAAMVAVAAEKIARTRQ